MEDKNVKRWNMYFKVAHWIFIIGAALSFWVIVRTAIGMDEVTVVNHICANVTIIVESLMLAFIFMKTKVTKALEFSFYQGFGGDKTMKTLDEAIVHTREKAEENRRYAKECEECANRKIDKLMKLDKIHQRDMQSCIKCAEEHEQLAEWLEELKSLRNVSELWEYNNNLAYQQGRTDTIDEFIERLLHCGLGDYNNIPISEIKKIAEQLKTGE